MENDSSQNGVNGKIIGIGTLTEEEKTLFDSGIADKQLNYWKNHLSADMPLLSLPADYNRPSVQTSNGDSVKYRIDAELAKQLSDFGSKMNTTLFMNMLTVFSILLGRLSGNTDIPVGAPIVGRNIKETEEMMGFFINTIILRCDLSGVSSFEDHLQRVKEVCLGAYENKDIPFERLVEELSPVQSLSHNPLVQVLLNIQNQRHTEITLPNVMAEKILLEDTYSKFDMNLYVSEIEDTVELNLVFNRDLYKKERIQEFILQLEVLIKEMVQNPKQDFNKVSLVTKRSNPLISLDSLNPEFASDECLHEKVAHMAAKYPSNIAITDKEKDWTYEEINSKSNCVANRLRAEGIKEGDVIVIYATNDATLVISMLGILKAGAAFCIIDPGYPLMRKMNSIKLINPSGVICLYDAKERELRDYYENQRVYITRSWIMQNDESDKTEFSSSVKSDAIAYVAFTSGTTGTPNALMGAHASVAHFINWHVNEHDLTETDHFSMLSGLSHDPLLRDIFTPLSIGARLFIPPVEPRFMADTLAEWMQKNQITIAHTTPSLITMMAESSAIELPYMRYYFLGGEALKNKHISLLKKISPSAHIVNFYGATETPQAMGFYEISEDTSNATVPIGRGIDGVYIVILNNQGIKCGIGELGEICIATEFLTVGYINNAELNKARFETIAIGEKQVRLYRTGDLGRYLPDGQIVCIARKDNQLNIRGYRIEIGEIESAISSHPNVSDAIARIMEDTNKQEMIVAYYVPKSGQQVNAESIKKFLSDFVPMYAIPQYFISIDKVPLTPNGKVMYSELPLPVGKINTGVEYAAPENETEQKLAQIWQEILGVERVGINESFFELGGHSLKATSLVTRIRKVFNSEVTLRDVFNNRTIKEFSKCIAGAKKSIYSPIQLVDEMDCYPVSSAQKRLYLLNQIEGANISYNLPTALIMEGKLDRERLEKAIKSLVRRHEALRTSFEFINGWPVQIIHKDADLQIQYMEAEKDSINRIFEEFVRPFDLSTAPLLRVALIKLGEEKHVLMFDVHHIVLDGTSVEIFMKEFVDIYNKKVLQELKIRYRDFSAWHNELLESSIIKRQREYWLGVFAGEIPAMNMPTDFPRPSSRSIEGDKVKVKISSELAAKLREAANKNNSTLYMILLAVYNVLLFKYTGQEDIVVGSGTAGRLHPDLENIMGMFVNTIMMRNYPCGDRTFREFLQEVRENTLMAYDNQSYPFERLVEELGIERDPGRRPLHDTVFMLQNIDIPQMQVEGLKITVMEPEFTIAEIDLSLYAVEKDNAIDLTFIYCTKLFSRETIEKLSKYYVKIAEAITADEEILIKDIQVLDDEERNNILSKVKQPKKEIMFDFDY